MFKSCLRPWRKEYINNNGYWLQSLGPEKYKDQHQKTLLNSYLSWQWPHICLQSLHAVYSKVESEDVAQQDGWVPMSVLGVAIRHSHPQDLRQLQHQDTSVLSKENIGVLCQMLLSLLSSGHTMTIYFLWLSRAHETHPGKSTVSRKDMPFLSWILFSAKGGHPEPTFPLAPQLPTHAVDVSSRI